MVAGDLFPSAWSDVLPVEDMVDYHRIHPAGRWLGLHEIDRVEEEDQEEDYQTHQVKGQEAHR